MIEPSRLVVVERGEDALRLLSPGVGWWSGGPVDGAIVGAGSAVGRLRWLTRSAILVVPEGVTGRVLRLSAARTLAVGYGQALLEIEELSGDAPARADRERPGGAGELPAGCAAVISPTDGVFYRRPSPGAAPYVEVGSRVRTGQPIGLVEVMKTFNQIVYEGPPALPEEAEVLELRCDDGAEVGAGQLLLVVR